MNHTEKAIKALRDEIWCSGTSDPARSRPPTNHRQWAVLFVYGILIAMLARFLTPYIPAPFHTIGKTTAGLWVAILAAQVLLGRRGGAGALLYSSLISIHCFGGTEATSWLLFNIIMWIIIVCCVPQDPRMAFRLACLVNRPVSSRAGDHGIRQRPIFRSIRGLQELWPANRRAHAQRGCHRSGQRSAKTPLFAARE